MGLKKQKEASNELELIDWLNSHPALKNQQSLAHTFERREFTQQHWPFLEESFNPIPPLFLMQVTRLRLLHTNDRWFVRDGLLGLMWFFKRFPKPGPLKSILCLDCRWKGIVPKAWRSHVQYWETVSLKQSKPIKKVLVVGLALSSSCLSSELRLKLDHAKKLISMKKGRIQKSAYLPVRLNPVDNEKCFHLQFFSDLLQNLGPNLETTEFIDLKSRTSLQETKVFNLFSKLLVSDDFLTSLVLIRGGSVDQVRSVRDENKMTVRLSPYHGYILTSKHATLAEEQKLKVDLHQVLKSSMSTSFPWPRWFGFKDNQKA